MSSLLSFLGCFFASLLLPRSWGAENFSQLSYLAVYSDYDPLLVASHNGRASLRLTHQRRTLHLHVRSLCSLTSPSHILDVYPTPSLNVSTKTFALISAALLLLDFASTAIVSAATAAAYLAGEVTSLPFPTWVGAVVVLALFTAVSLMGVRESARIALAVLSLHVSFQGV